MSAQTVASSKRRKRMGPEVREEALAIARRLLLERGPSAVTLANVGDELSMTHANVLYHFGSASGLQSTLMQSMINDLTVALNRIAATLDGSIIGPVVVVDHIFHAFNAGGAGPVAAWIILSGKAEYLAPLHDALNFLAGEIASLEGGARANERVRQAVLMITVAAFGDAVFGPNVRGMLGETDDTMRVLVARSLSLVSIR